MVDLLPVSWTALNRETEWAMKRSKFSAAQIAFVLSSAEDGMDIEEMCRKTGIDEATFYTWRNKYAGLMPVGDAATASA